MVELWLLVVEISMGLFWLIKMKSWLFQKGFSIAVQRGLHAACAEIDVINVGNKVKSCCFDSVCGAIIEDVIKSLALVGGFICRYISHQGNMVAQSMANWLLWI